MKKLWLILISCIVFASCGGGGSDTATSTPTTPSVEGSQYVLNVDTKAAEIILPPASPVTLQQVSQNSIFSLYREPYSGNFNEGNIDNALVVNLKVLNIPNRTLVPFEITGIAVADIQSMVLNGVSYQPALTGYFDLGAQGAVGYANLVIIFKADQVTEGTETMNLKLLSSIATVNSLSVNAVINDTSTTPVSPPPTYTLAKLPASGAVNEGDSVSITLNTTGVAAGTLVVWNIIGISADDIAVMVLNGVSQAPTLSGNFILDSVGSASMTVLFKNDLTTEGAETMTLGVVAAGQPTVSISINDTSTTPAPVVDNTNPTIALTSITNFVENTYLTVLGVAVDNVGIASVVWINRINSVIVGQGTATLTQNGNYATWTVINLPLQTGNNNIEFIATDTSGRTVSEIIVVSGNLATTAATSQTSFDEPTLLAENSNETMLVAMGDTYQRPVIKASPNVLRQLGIDSDIEVDLVVLNIPKPPIESHPCNKGNIVYFHHLEKVVNTYENWWLLASQTHSNRFNAESVNFYWIQQIADQAYGSYDTGIIANNSNLKLGEVDAKLNLGWIKTPYAFSPQIGIGSFPTSRTELCEY